MYTLIYEQAYLVGIRVTKLIQHYIELCSYSLRDFQKAAIFVLQANDRFAHLIREGLGRVFVNKKSTDTKSYGYDNESVRNLSYNFHNMSKTRHAR